MAKPKPKDNETKSFAILLIHKPAFKFFMLWLMSFLVLSGSLMTSFLNSYNFLEVRPVELLFPLVMHFVTSIILTLVIFFIPWPKLFSSKLITLFILSFLMVGYNDRLNNVIDIYRSIIPFLPTQANDAPVISVFFMATIFLIAILIGLLSQKYLKTRDQSSKNNLAYLIFIIVGVIFAGQAFKVSAMMPGIIKESKTQAPELVKTTSTSSNTSKPDIYYIVLDRYTNSQVLKDQFAYDNSDFTDFLKTNGFYIKEDAASNYPLTTMSISSTLNANYTKNLVKPYVNYSVQSRVLYHNLISQSSVIKALKNEGYTYYHIGSVYGATYKAPLADKNLVSASYMTVFNKLGKNLRGIEIGQFNQSPYYQLFKVNLSWWPFKDAELDNVSYVRAQLDSLNQLASSKSGGRFIFAHILVPHDPFTFNADGSTSAYQATDNEGKPIKQKYLEQVKFINSQIKRVIGTVNANSGGKAVVILNADEGAYPQDMNNTNMNPINTAGVLEKGNMSAWPTDWLDMKFGVLQAVHIPNSNQQELDKNLSSVNMFRIILNNYFSYGLDYLPNCNFATNKGDEYMYKYTDITQKLIAQSQNNQYCKALQTN